MNAYAKSVRLDDERIVAVVVTPEANHVRLRFRNGAKATEVPMSMEAFRAVGDLALLWFDGKHKKEAPSA